MILLLNIFIAVTPAIINIISGKLYQQCSSSYRTMLPSIYIIACEYPTACVSRVGARPLLPRMTR